MEILSQIKNITRSLAIYSWKNLIRCMEFKQSFEKNFYKFLKIFLKSNASKYFIGRTYKLSDIKKAFEDLRTGKVLRPTIKF